MRASMGSAVPKWRTHEATNSQQNAHNAERRRDAAKLLMISLPDTTLVRTFT